MLKFKNPFASPFRVETTEAKKETVEGFNYVPSAYCQLMDEMIGKRSRPWSEGRSPVRLIKVGFLPIMPGYTTIRFKGCG